MTLDTTKMDYWNGVEARDQLAYHWNRSSIGGQVVGALRYQHAGQETARLRTHLKVEFEGLTDGLDEWWQLPPLFKRTSCKCFGTFWLAFFLSQLLMKPPAKSHERVSQFLSCIPCLEHNGACSEHLASQCWCPHGQTHLHLTNTFLLY